MSTFVCNNKQNATMYKNTLYSMVKWFITHVGQANENSWIALSNDLVLDKSDCLKFTRVEKYIYIYYILVCCSFERHTLSGSLKRQDIVEMVGLKVALKA